MPTRSSQATTSPTAGSGSETFEPAGDGTARPVHSAEVEAPCAFFAIGKPGCFDNHIHRITCLSPTGHSLHVYSDDALRGEVYGEADE